MHDDPEELVTIYHAANSAEAFIIRNALESEGIACQVAEANEPLAGLSIVEPDVMVKAKDRARAEQIIVDWENARDNESDEDEDESEDYGDETPDEEEDYTE
jgi:hypothetical protein